MTIGHVTQASLLPPDEFALLARRLVGAGVGVTILPATDLYLMGRATTHARPRGVVQAGPLLAHGVNCTISTNNVLNPFTPYGDASLIRMANLYANVCHEAGEAALGNCMAMITDRAARQMRIPAYGIAEGAPANLVLLDAIDPASAIAELAQPLWGLKAGRMTFRRERPVLLPPSRVPRLPAVRYIGCPWQEVGAPPEFGSADEILAGKLGKSRRCRAVRRHRSGATAPRSPGMHGGPA